MNTGMPCYDGRTLHGTVNNSADVPNCRPNFYEETGWYTITLQSLWSGYPPNMGEIHINDLPDMESDTFHVNKYNNNNILRHVRDNKPSKKSGLTSEQLFWILISLFVGIPVVILIVIFLVKMSKRG
jgi:hypothetical protein